MNAITIRPGQLPVSLALRNTSALAFCTELEPTDDGHVAFVKNWPSLSNGEERLWAVLAWLNGQGDLPDLDDLRAHLDEANYRAATDALVSA